MAYMQTKPPVYAQTQVDPLAQQTFTADRRGGISG